MRSRAALALIVLALIGLAAGIGAFLVYSRGGGYCPETHAASRNGGGQAGLPGIEIPSVESSGGGGCERLYHVREARFLGIHYSVWAPFFFAATLVLSILYYVGVAIVLPLLALLYAIGTVFVPWLVHLELKYGVFCPYCTIMHITIIISLIIIVYLIIKKNSLSTITYRPGRNNPFPITGVCRSPE